MAASLRRVVAAAGAHQVGGVCRASIGDRGNEEEEEEGKQLGRHG